MLSITDQFKRARQSGAPLLCFRTADPAATIHTLAQIATEQDGEIPILTWNLTTALTSYGAAGEAWLRANQKQPLFDPTAMLAAVAQMDADGLVFMHQAHRYWNDTPTCQAIWNLRDVLKAQGATLVMLSTIGATLPAELAQDVLLLDEPLPDLAQLRKIVTETHENAELPAPTEETLVKATDALIGLAAFPAEQSTAMCISKKHGLDLDALWNRKRAIIEQTPGLTVTRDGQTFEQIGGNQNAISFLRQIHSGRKRLRGLMFVDEIEKAFAGFGTDTSGTKTEMVGTFLPWSEKIPCLLYRGVPGSGKSAIAKAAGNTFGIPTVRMNFEAMQGSLVGQTGERMRAALAMIDAMFGTDCLLIATMNRTGDLPPEMQSRFQLGTFFFDLPSQEERRAIWTIYRAKFELPDQPLPKDDQWTGREIEACCFKAWMLNCSLVDAAAYVVPVAVAAGEEIEKMRSDAAGRYISASKPGVYQLPAAQAKPSRKIKDEGPLVMGPKGEA